MKFKKISLTQWHHKKKTKKDVLSFLTYDCAKLYFHRYKEVCKFNFNNPGWGYRTGHFTQVVWKKSVELGIGKAVSGRCTYVVGRYKPAGNVLNNFRENVAKGSFQSSYCRRGVGGL